MAIKIDSEASCRAAYIDYYTNENTKVSAEDMRRIVQRYDDATRRSWQVAFTKSSNDENRYEFDDEQFEDIRLESYEETEDEYGEDVNVKAEKAKNVVDGTNTGIAAVGGAAGAAIGAGAAMNVLGIQGGGILGKILGKLGKMGVTTLGKNPATQKFVSTSGLVGYIVSGISCILSFVTGLMAKTNKVNEEEVKAVNELKGEIETQQGVIDEKQTELKDIQKQIRVASDKATEENDDANKDIENLAGDHEFHSKIYLNYKAKEDRGERLSQSERMEYEYRARMMGSTSDIIKTRCKAADETFQENKDAINGFESDFDGIAGSLAEIKGTTDFAAEIDEATKKSCDNQAKIQKINSIAGYTAAAGMAISTAVFAAEIWAAVPLAIAVIAGGAVLAGLAITGAVFSGKASKEQAEYSIQVGEEVDLRVKTEGANANAVDNLEEGIDDYSITKSTIESETISKPNDLVQPSAVTVNPFNNSNNDDEQGNKPRYLT